jgi:hypothetical protein
MQSRTVNVVDKTRTLKRCRKFLGGTGAISEALTCGLSTWTAGIVNHSSGSGSRSDIVYEKVGLAVLRTTWVNMDLVWAGAMVLTGLLTLMI